MLNEFRMNVVEWINVECKNFDCWMNVEWILNDCCWMIECWMYKCWLLNERMVNLRMFIVERIIFCFQNYFIVEWMLYDCIDCLMNVFKINFGEYINVNKGLFLYLKTLRLFANKKWTNIGSDIMNLYLFGY